MQDHIIEKKIMQAMSFVFEIPETEIDEHSSIDTIQSWDSLRQLNLMIALEEEFNIQIPDEDIGNLVNFKLISYIVKELVGENNELK